MCVFVVVFTPTFQLNACYTNINIDIGGVTVLPSATLWTTSAIEDGKHKGRSDGNKLSKSILYLWLDWWSTER